MTLWEWSEWDQRLNGPAIIHDYQRGPNTPHGPGEVEGSSSPGIDWVIVGGESGPNHPADGCGLVGIDDPSV